MFNQLKNQLWLVLFASAASLGLTGLAEAQLVVDQEATPFRNGGYTGGAVIQSFTPSADNLAGVDADFYNFSGTRDLTLNLWAPGAWNGSVLTGSALFSQTLSDVAGCASNDLACQEFRFDSTPIGLNPGDLYYIELVWDTTLPLGSGAIGAFRTTDPSFAYADGQVLCAIGCGNTQDGDILFRTYSVVPEPGTALLVGMGLVGLSRRREGAR